LLAALTPQEVKEVKTNRPNNTEAYEYYLKGRYINYNEFSISGKLSSFRIVEKMFKKAIELDPNYSDSYAGLADLYNTYYNTDSLSKTEADKDKYLHIQESYLDTAMLLNPNSSEVYKVKGMVHLAKKEMYDAIKSELIAIKLNRNDHIANWTLAMIYTQLGLGDLALKYLDISIKLNPLYILGYLQRGLLYTIIGNFENAISDFKKSIKLDPNNGDFYAYYVNVLIMTKKFEEAEHKLTMLQELNPDHRLLNLYRAQLYAAEGEKEKALESYNGILRYLIYAFLGMKEEFIDAIMEVKWLKSPKSQSLYLYLQNYTMFDRYRSDPRFQEILAKHKELYEENLKKYGDLVI